VEGRSEGKSTSHEPVSNSDRGMITWKMVCKLPVSAGNVNDNQISASLGVDGCSIRLSWWLAIQSWRYNLCSRVSV
jgi:hypothetical protein